MKVLVFAIKRPVGFKSTPKTGMFYRAEVLELLHLWGIKNTTLCLGFYIEKESDCHSIIVIASNRKHQK